VQDLQSRKGAAGPTGDIAVRSADIRDRLSATFRGRPHQLSAAVQGRLRRSPNVPVRHEGAAESRPRLALAPSIYRVLALTGDEVAALLDVGAVVPGVDGRLLAIPGHLPPRKAHW
jgi:hypothetical protein